MNRDTFDLETETIVTPSTSMTSTGEQTVAGLRIWSHNISHAIQSLDRLRGSRRHSGNFADLIGALRQEVAAIDQSIAALVRVQASMPKDKQKSVKRVPERRLQIVHWPS
jgi:hypothetical protein